MRKYNTKHASIELNTKTDNLGNLKFEYHFNKPENNVRILILINEEPQVMENEKEEKLWLEALASNPSFDFLNDEKENIYSLTDGKPFND